MKLFKETREIEFPLNSQVMPLVSIFTKSNASGTSFWKHTSCFYYLIIDHDSLELEETLSIDTQGSILQNYPRWARNLPSAL